MGALHRESVEYESEPVQAKARFVERFGRYRDLLFRRWWFLVVGLALGLVVTGGFWWFRPRLFTSVGRMIVSIKLAIPEGSVYSEELGNFLGTQAALMRSGVVLNRAQARLLKRDPTGIVEPISLKVAISPKTSIFVLEATGSDSKTVQSFLQGCMEEYIQLKKEMRTQTSDATVAGLTEELVRLERDLRHCEDELTDFQRSNSVVLLQEQGNAVGSYVANLNQRLAVLKAEDALLQSLGSGQYAGSFPEARSSMSEASSAAGTVTGRSAPNEQQENELLRARQQVLVLKAEQRDLERYLRPKHPKMIALGEDIARRETMLNILLEQNVAELENRKTSLARQMRYLDQELAEWNGKALECSQKMAEYQRVRANQQRVQALYDRLLTTLQTLDLNKEISPESVTILEPASTAFPESANWFKRFMGATLAAVVLSIAVLLFLDHVDDRLNSISELEEWFEESVLAQIPLQKPARRGEQVALLTSDDSRHALVEALRSLRSSLLYQVREAPKPNVLLLTSSVPGEGKSLVSANLAITMAQAKTRVLLMDADLRKGVLHQRFDLTPKRGLSEVLMGKCNWEDGVVATEYPGLSLLPRGPTTSSSSELFLGPTMRELLRSAAASYDVVILDAAPVMAADDVTSLAPLADAVLFVLRAEHTSARVARASLELLYRRQVKVLGLVFNAVRPRNADYYPYYRYGHYSRLGSQNPATHVIGPDAQS